MKLRVYIVDRYPLVRRGLTELIGTAADMEVCGEAAEAEVAAAAIMTLNPQIVIVEMSLKGCSGLELIKALRRSAPQVGILVLSMHDERIYAPRAIRAGARGFVSKQAPNEQVIEAIRRIHQGRLCFSQAVQSEMLAGMVRGREHGSEAPASSLSERELEIGGLISDGATTREIATHLRVSVKTVETHRAHIKEKLGLQNSAQLVQFCVGWLGTDDDRGTATRTRRERLNGHTVCPQPASDAGRCGPLLRGGMPSTLAEENHRASGAENATERPA